MPLGMMVHDVLEPAYSSNHNCILVPEQGMSSGNRKGIIKGPSNCKSLLLNEHYR